MRFQPRQLKERATLAEIKERQLQLLRGHLDYLQRCSPY